MALTSRRIACAQALGSLSELGPMLALLRRQWADGASPGAPDQHVCNAALGACSRVGAIEQAMSLKVTHGIRPAVLAAAYLGNAAMPT